VFVDEFQDTDPLQAEILLLLCADDPSDATWTAFRPVPGKLFIVGDPKQSIYRFRRADVGVYRDVCEQLAARGRRLALTTSFRSVPDIQRFVNAAFAPRMTGDRDTLQADYVPLAPDRPFIPDQPSVVALPVPKPYGKRNISGAAIDASLPDATGAFVEWLVHRQRVAGHRTGIGRHARASSAAAHLPPVPPLRELRCRRDALLRRWPRSAWHQAPARRRPCVSRSRGDRNAARGAWRPSSGPTTSCRCSPRCAARLFAIGDEELLEYRHRFPRALHPFRVPEALPHHLAPIGEALGVLAELHKRRNRRPVAETITRLFDATRAHVAFALRPAGEQVLANALHVAELARQYEMSGGFHSAGSSRSWVAPLQTVKARKRPSSKKAATACA
jgi:hypothetical protein